MTTKKCGGYFGKCYGSDDFIVDVGKFGKRVARKDGLQNMCKSCTVQPNRVSNAKRDWAMAERGLSQLGLAKLYREHPEESIMDKNRWVKYNADIKRSREEMGLTRDEYRDLPIGIRKARERGDNVIQLPTKPVIPKFDDGSPKTTRKQSKRLPTGATKEGPGFVYIYQDERIPEDLKIGAEKVEHGRLGQAGTWGFYRRVFGLPFDRRFEAETMVHDILASKRIVINKEFFKCSIQEAKVAIKAAALRCTNKELNNVNR